MEFILKQWSEKFIIGILETIKIFISVINQLDAQNF